VANGLAYSVLESMTKKKKSFLPLALQIKFTQDPSKQNIGWMKKMKKSGQIKSKIKCTKRCFNWDKSAARFCHQMAAWFPHMFCDFYLVTKSKIC